MNQDLLYKIQFLYQHLAQDAVLLVIIPIALHKANCAVVAIIIGGMKNINNINILIISVN